LVLRRIWEFVSNTGRCHSTHGNTKNDIAATSVDGTLQTAPHYVQPSEGLLWLRNKDDDIFGTAPEGARAKKGDDIFPPKPQFQL